MSSYRCSVMIANFSRGSFLCKNEVHKLQVCCSTYCTTCKYNTDANKRGREGYSERDGAYTAPAINLGANLSPSLLLMRHTHTFQAILGMAGSAILCGIVWWNLAWFRLILSSAPCLVSRITSSSSSSPPISPLPITVTRPERGIFKLIHFNKTKSVLTLFKEVLRNV